MKLFPFSLFFVFLIVVFLSHGVYAFVQITEIRFSGGEYLELYHNESLNLSGKRIFDSSISSSFNTLEEIALQNSSFTLIFGARFLDDINLSSLHCNLYQSDRSQLTNGGLKDSGEELILEINQTQNLSFFPETSFTFLENESLHYDSNTSTFFKAKLSPCSLSFLEQINESLDPITQDNASLEEINTSVEENETISCPSFFELSVENQIFDKNIKFKHHSDASEFTLFYWIEDFNAQILKTNKSTTNFNEKSFTPSFKESKAMLIKSELHVANCKVMKNETLIFHRGEEEEQQIEEEICPFKILKTKDVFNERIEFSFQVPKEKENYSIQYHIETLDGSIVKKEVETKNNHLKSFTPQEKSTEVYKVVAQYESSSCEVKDEEIFPFYVEVKENPLITINTGITVEERKEGIEALVLEDNTLFFSLYLREETFENGTCKILKNTKVLSEEKELSGGENLLFLKINTSYLDTTDDEYELSLRCSYFKAERKTPEILRESFNYTYSSKKEVQILEQESEKKLLDVHNTRKEEVTKQTITEEESYLSKSLKYKTYAPYGVISALTLLLGALFLRVSI